MEMTSLDNIWICPPCGATVKKKGNRSAAVTTPAAPVATPDVPTDGYTEEERLQYHKDMDAATYQKQHPQGEPRWQWKNDNNEWQDYSDRHQGELMRQHKKCKEKLTLRLSKSKSGVIMINPRQMKQVISVTHKIRSSRYAHANEIDFPPPLGKRGAAKPASSSGPAPKRPRFHIKAKGPPSQSLQGQDSSSPGRQVKRLPMPPGMPPLGVPFDRNVVPRHDPGDLDPPQPSLALAKAVYGLRDRQLDATAPLPPLLLQPVPPLQPPPPFPPLPVQLTPQQVAELPAIDADGVIIIDRNAIPPALQAAPIAACPPTDDEWTAEQWETYDRKGREYTTWRENKDKARGGGWKKGRGYSQKKYDTKGPGDYWKDGKWLEEEEDKWADWRSGWAGEKWASPATLSLMSDATFPVSASARGSADPPGAGPDAVRYHTGPTPESWETPRF